MNLERIMLRKSARKGQKLVLLMWNMKQKAANIKSKQTKQLTVTDDKMIVCRREGS